MELETLNQACKEYQAFASTTVLPQCEKETYFIFGLWGELGEVAGDLAKYEREDFSKATLRAKLVDEIGDVWWFVSNLLRFWDTELSFNSDYMIDFSTRENWEELGSQYLGSSINDLLSTILNPHYRKLGGIDSLILLANVLYQLCEWANIDVVECFDFNRQKLLARKEKGAIQNHE